MNHLPPCGIQPPATTTQGRLSHGGIDAGRTNDPTHGDAQEGVEPRVAAEREVGDEPEEVRPEGGD